MMGITSSMLDLDSAGTNSQIKEGAVLVKTAQYVLAILTNNMRLTCHSTQIINALFI